MTHKKADGVAPFGTKSHLLPPVAEPQTKEDTGQDKPHIGIEDILVVAHIDRPDKKGNAGKYEIGEIASEGILDGTDVFQKDGDLIIPPPLPAPHMQTEVG